MQKFGEAGEEAVDSFSGFLLGGLESSGRRKSRAKGVKGGMGEGLPEKLAEVVGHHIISYSC